MIALAEAGDSAKHKLDELLVQCREALASPDAEIALATIGALLPHCILEQRHSDLIAIELAHFRHVRSKNIRSARSMKNARARGWIAPSERSARAPLVVEAPDEILAAIDHLPLADQIKQIDQDEALPAILGDRLGDVPGS